MDLWQGKIYRMEDIYSILKEEILMLKLHPGAVISETEIAQRFHVSRTPVRSAFGKLRGDRLINIVPQKGTYVTLLDFDYIQQLVYMREKIEHHILLNAIKHQTTAFMERLLINLQAQKKLLSGHSAVDQAAFFQLDGQFHQHCYALSNKEKLWSILDQIDNQYTRYRILYYSVSKCFEILYREHCKMFKIISERHTWQAEDFCRAHLNGYAADINNYIRKHYASFFVQPEPTQELGEVSDGSVAFFQ